MQAWINVITKLQIYMWHVQTDAGTEAIIDWHDWCGWLVSVLHVDDIVAPGDVYALTYIEASTLQWTVFYSGDSGTHFFCLMLFQNLPISGQTKNNMT